MLRHLLREPRAVFPKPVLTPFFEKEPQTEFVKLTCNFKLPSSPNVFGSPPAIVSAGRCVGVGARQTTERERERETER